MAELLLIVRFGGQRVALRAADVEAAVELDALTPVPGAPPHVAGLASLRSRVLTVIDCAASLDPRARVSDGSCEAVVAVVDGHPYALLVEGVEDVVESEGGEAAPIASLTPGWARIARGAVDAGGDFLLLSDIEALVAGSVAAAA